MPNPLDELPGTVKERTRITVDDLSESEDELNSFVLLKTGPDKKRALKELQAQHEEMTQPSEPQHVDANPTAKRQAHEADTCASAAAVDLVYENEVIDEKDAALLERHRQQKAQLQKLGTGFGLLEEVEGDMDDETTAESAASTSYASALHKPAHIWLNLMSETEPTSLVRCMRDEPLRVGLLPQAVESFGFRPERVDITLKGQRLALDQTPRSLGLADKALLVAVQKAEKRVKLKLSHNSEPALIVITGYDAPFSQLISSYCKRAMGGEVDPTCVQLRFDGDILNPNQKPRDLDMEDQDMIEIVLRK